MIMVSGWVRLAPDDIERFLPAVRAMVAASGAEPGCLEYAFARDLFEADVLRISERWADQAALDAHFATSHMATFNAAIAGAGLKAGSVKVYACEEIRTIIAL